MGWTEGKMKRRPCYFAETGKSKGTEVHKRRLGVETLGVKRRVCWGLKAKGIWEPPLQAHLWPPASPPQLCGSTYYYYSWVLLLPYLWVLMASPLTQPIALSTSCLTSLWPALLPITASCAATGSFPIVPFTCSKTLMSSPSY